MSEDQAIIEVGVGMTKTGKDYIYSIIKTKMKSFGVQYFMLLQIDYGSIVLNIKAAFTEKGMTGERDTLVMELMRREGVVTFDYDNEKVNGWWYDPYDKKSTRKYTMNLSEQDRFDKLFPEHPLSQCRKFLYYIKDNL